MSQLIILGKETDCHLVVPLKIAPGMPCCRLVSVRTGRLSNSSHILNETRVKRLECENDYKL